MVDLERIRREFPDAAKRSPCSDELIRRAAETLGEALPVDLETCYRAFDGFRGPTNAQFFWPLFAERDDLPGLVRLNKFFRDNSDSPFPPEIVLSTLFFGDDGIGAQWGFHRDHPGKVIKWDASWGSDFEIAGDSMEEAWLACKAFYEQI